MEWDGAGLYKNRRIHVARLVYGVYKASVVRPGPTGASVETIGGEYPTREEAVAAAIAHIDQHDANGRR